MSSTIAVSGSGSVCPKETGSEKSATPSVAVVGSSGRAGRRCSSCGHRSTAAIVVPSSLCPSCSVMRGSSAPLSSNVVEALICDGNAGSSSASPPPPPLTSGLHGATPRANALRKRFRLQGRSVTLSDLESTSFGVHTSFSASGGGVFGAFHTSSSSGVSPPPSSSSSFSSSILSAAAESSSSSSASYRRDQFRRRKAITIADPDHEYLTRRSSERIRIRPITKHAILRRRSGQGSHLIFTEHVQ